MTYEIRRDGPDDASTYAACWGPSGTLGDLIVSTITAEAARLAVSREGGWGGLTAYRVTRSGRVSLTVAELRRAAEAERKRHPTRHVWS
jgi:hypothetical protein